MNPTPEQVTTQVTAMLKSRPDARIFGIYSRAGWRGDDSIVVNGSQWPVKVCRSPLEMSCLLADERGEDGLVILTPLQDDALSLDVLSRLAGRRLVHIDRWEVVREAYGASRIDPRLPIQGWVADALIAAMPDAGFSPVLNGWLSADVAWQTLLAHYLDLSPANPSASDLIDWSVNAECLSRYKALAEPLRLGLRNHLAETAGALGECFAAAIEAGQGEYLLPIGLVCEVLFGDDGSRDPILSQAIARLEPFTEGQTLTTAQGQAWYEAARAVIDRLPTDQRGIWIERAEALLGNLKASRFAGLSTVFSSGFQQRLAIFGKALSGYLDQSTPLGEVEGAFDAVRYHSESAVSVERVERLGMALRLTRQLAGSSGITPPSLGGLAESQRLEGTFIDWARRYLLGGDPVKELAAALGQLYSRIRDIREKQNREFAQLLRAWNTNQAPEHGLLPIERFLDAVVKPVAAKMPVMVVVVDGMDGGVFEELSEDMRHRGWARWADSSGVGAGSLLSALPSVTEYSRAALLTGHMAPGVSSAEKVGFRKHEGLRAESRSSKPPILFHKGELSDVAAHGLAVAVRTSLGDPEQRIVGVVMNAVDDHLAKSEQLRQRWSVDSFRVLDALLYEARLAGRAVIMTSDHGHVLESDSEQLQGESEERWRPYTESLTDQEKLFEGPRIRAATGAARAVLLWSETARYSRKKNGYHGGASLQEVIVPLGIFLSVGQELDGWSELPERLPEWWLASAPLITGPSQPTKIRGKKTSTAPTGQATLFETLEQDAVVPVSEWIRQLPETDVYAAQLKLAGRLAPPTEMVQQVLTTLEKRGSRVPKRLLAQVVKTPEFRLRGLMAGMQRLLNVDGYQILAVEDETDTVLLDIELLRKQFQIGDSA